MHFTTRCESILAHRATLPDRPTPHTLGVDEWAYRRGQDYKTILVDLNANFDLLRQRVLAS